MNRGTDGDNLVGVDALVRLLAEDVLDDLLHARHARRAADQDDFIDVRRLELGVFEGLDHRTTAALEEVSVSFSNWARVMVMARCLGPLLIGRDERQVDVGRGLEREVLLGFLGCLLEPLKGHLIFAEVDPLLFLELIGDVVHQGLVPVVAAQWVSPLVERTSKTPSATSRIEMSNVPPPRSKTAIFSFFFLSSP